MRYRPLTTYDAILTHNPHKLALPNTRTGQRRPRARHIGFKRPIRDFLSRLQINVQCIVFIGPWRLLLVRAVEENVVGIQVWRGRGFRIGRLEIHVSVVVEVLGGKDCGVTVGMKPVENMLPIGYICVGNGKRTSGDDGVGSSVFGFRLCLAGSPRLTLCSCKHELSLILSSARITALTLGL